MMLVFLIFPLFLGISEQACKNPFFAVNGFDGCLYYGTSAVSYSQAYSTCHTTLGATLVSIHNALQIQSLLQVFQQDKVDAVPFWIGLYRSNPRTGSWQWDDGSAYDYTRLGTSDDGNRNVMMLATGNWLTESETQLHPYFCHKSQCPNGWSYFDETGSCYGVAYNMTFNDGEAYCQKNGGHLVSIHSKKEDDFVNQVAYSKCAKNAEGSPHEVVIGAKWNDTAHKIVSWTDGSSVNYLGSSCGSFGESLVRLSASDSGCGSCKPGQWLNGYGTTHEVFTRLVCKVKPI